ncbi:MAG: type II toxin-antitoxin system RelE/ParE family toxin [Candidatus Thiodiazotropha sp.]|nr:type II toxin-antitoxin system RelE/ParE family toxin [Candidatus Thiodiazotropha taylori]
MLIIRKEAKKDIENTYQWYEDQQKGLGRLFLTEVERQLEYIHSSPQQYPLIDKLVRRALCKRFPYAIYYIHATNVTVLALLHQRRHPAAWNRR